MSGFFYKTRNPILETLGQLAMVTSVIIAVLYPFHVIPINPILVKGSAVGFLALYTLFRLRNFDHFLLFIALIANAIGDMQIAQTEPNALFDAMRSFMVGHVLLILIFLRNRISAYEISSLRVRGAALLWAAAGIGIFLLWPELDDARNQVLIYSSALIGMATAGLFSRFTFKLVGYGVIFYVLSDTLIGAREFLDAPSWLNIVTWGLYYLAQLMITAGILLAPERDKPLPMR